MPLMCTEEVDGITPPVPAAVRVTSDSNRLRVEYDDVVQLSDFVVASVPSKRVSNHPSKCVNPCTFPQQDNAASLFNFMS